MQLPEGFKTWWESQTASNKRMILGGSVIAVVIAASMTFDNKKPTQKTAAQKAAAEAASAKSMTVVAPGVSNHSTEQLAAEVTMLNRQLGEQGKRTDDLSKQAVENEKQSAELLQKNQEIAGLKTDLDQMRQEMTLMKSGMGNPGPVLNSEIQLPQVSANVPPLPQGGVPAAGVPDIPVAPPKPTLRIISASGSAGFSATAPGMNDVNNGLGSVSASLNKDLTPEGRQVQTAGQQGQVNGGASADAGAFKPRKDETFIPAGSIIEGVLLNGMDAPTSGVARKNPVPALLRVKKDAILPNRYAENIRECFVILAGEGELSSERAKMRSETISCVRKDGGIIEASIDGYITGEDGKVGMRGRLVSKQGSILAKTFMSGLASGIAQVLTPQQLPQVALASPSGGSAYATVQPSLGDVGQAGAYRGVSNAAQQLSKFYLDMAMQMFPVIEIDAGRKATLILVRGTYLSLKPREG